MYKIKTLNKISEAGLKKFDALKYTYSNDAENPDAIMVRSAAMHDMEFGDNLLAIARAGAGTNNIPIDRCSQQGIVVFNTPGANANAVKELVVCALILSGRKIVKGIEWAQTLGGETDVAKAVEKGKSAFAGPEIKGKTLLVVGLGAIGRLVAGAAVALGMKVVGYDPYLSPEAEEALDGSVEIYKDLKEAFPVADYITLHVPATPETKGVVCSDNIDLMKDHVRILNFARGDLVVSGDIVKGIEDGKIAAYLTDFASADLIGVDGVTIMPHLGASTPESEQNCARMAADELIDFIENGNIKNSVNMPRTSTPRSGIARITVIHLNQPNMISKITDTISKDGVNIANFEDKNRGDYAYSIIDLDSEPNAKAVQDVKAIDGVIKVRVIK